MFFPKPSNTYPYAQSGGTLYYVLSVQFKYAVNSRLVCEIFNNIIVTYSLVVDQVFGVHPQILSDNENMSNRGEPKLFRASIGCVAKIMTSDEAKSVIFEYIAVFYRRI